LREWEGDEAQIDLFEVQLQPSQKDWDLETLKELSLEAYDAALHACMSELPVEGDIARFVEKVLAAANNAAARYGLASPEARAAADKARLDRGDPSVLAV
jgi:hypothetical protein